MEHTAITTETAYLLNIDYFDDGISREMAEAKEIRVRRRQKAEMEERDKERRRKQRLEYEILSRPALFMDPMNRGIIEPISNELMRELLEIHSNVELQYYGFTLPAAEEFQGEILGPFGDGKQLMVRLPNGERKLVHII